MLTRDEELARLLAQLPAAVRASLDDSDTLAGIYGTLSAEELKQVESIIDQIMRLPATSPLALEEALVEIDSIDRVADAVQLGGHEVFPTAAFQTSWSAPIVPDPDVFGRTERGQASYGALYPVWYATTRQPVHKTDWTQGFSGNRDPEGETRYGVARVYVPQSHTPGSLGSSGWYRWLWSWSDDRLKLRQLETRDEPRFWREIHEVLQDFEQQNLDEKETPAQVLLFVHGYNVCFADAMLRAAQLGCDLRIPGLTACYSWASKGTTQDYMTDEATVDVSVEGLATFIKQLKKEVDKLNPRTGGRIHILAHSMGNRIVLRALEKLRSESPEQKPNLGQIVLAAPDVDQQAFKLLAPSCLHAKRDDLQTTLYASHKDNPVKLSRWLHSYPRAGFLPPPTVVKGVTTIDVTRVNLSLLGHSTFAEARAVLEDISKVIHFNASPATRSLRPNGDGEQPYWHLD